MNSSVWTDVSRSLVASLRKVRETPLCVQQVNGLEGGLSSKERSKMRVLASIVRRVKGYGH